MLIEAAWSGKFVKEVTFEQSPEGNEEASRGMRE